MAISVDATSELSSSGWTSGSSHSWSHTCASDATALVVGFFHYDASITSVTYNGVSMTLVEGPVIANTVDRISVFWLGNPSSGTNTITVTMGASTGFNIGSGVSYKGTATATPTNTDTINLDNENSPAEITTVTLQDNSWQYAFFRVGAALTGTTAGTTKRSAIWDGSGCNSVDNNAAISPAGSNTVGVTHGASSTRELGIAFELEEAGGAAPEQNSNFFHFI